MEAAALFVIAVLVTCLLVIGSMVSAFVNAILVMVNITALTVLVALALPVMNSTN